jgi:hypothetical protein
MREVLSSNPSAAKKKKRDTPMEYWPSKQEVLNSNPNTAKKFRLKDIQLGKFGSCWV